MKETKNWKLKNTEWIKIQSIPSTEKLLEIKGKNSGTIKTT
jgi:hypothetical protein